MSIFKFLKPKRHFLNSELAEMALKADPDCIDNLHHDDILVLAFFQAKLLQKAREAGVIFENAPTGPYFIVRLPEKSII